MSAGGKVPQKSSDPNLLLALHMLLQAAAKKPGGSKKASKAAAETGPLPRSRFFAACVLLLISYGLHSYRTHCQ